VNVPGGVGIGRRGSGRVGVGDGRVGIGAGLNTAGGRVGIGAGLNTAGGGVGITGCVGTSTVTGSGAASRMQRGMSFGLG
jgi:hypothetical protein